MRLNDMEADFGDSSETDSSLATYEDCDIDSTITNQIQGKVDESGSLGTIPEKNPPPPATSGVEALKRFKDEGLWDKIIDPGDKQLVDCCMGASWLVSDRDADDCPLVHVTDRFEEYTGYAPDAVLGRNCRFLQPADTARNDVFNGDERKRIRTFCSDGKAGSMATLILNERADGRLFWNLAVLEHRTVNSRGYILACIKELSLHQDLLSMMHTWDHRSLGYISSLRLLLKSREPYLSPVPSRSLANEPMIAECFAEWSETIRQDLTDFWEGDHFVPPVGGVAARAFVGNWAPLLEVAEESIRKVHGLRGATLQHMRENTEGGIVCAVADPSGPDCPLVFVSKEFENMTGYKWDFALGRNCRFLQPNQRQFNLRLNGGEIAQMRHFCAYAHDRKVGSSIITLLLNERKGGERFWNLLHMTHVEVSGHRYILAVQTILDLPMPGFLHCNFSAEGYDTDPTVDLCMFLSKLRGRLQLMASKCSMSVHALSEDVLEEILGYMKVVTDDYEGDHYVPKVGLIKAQQFEDDKKWSGIFAEVSDDMHRIYEATEETYANTARDKHGGACCTVADPTADDCALVYISRGFEELTEYHSDWALGRNCRFLQPNARAYNDAYNLWERGQLREFCKIPPKKGRLLTLLVNENRDGYPFWNALVLKHVSVEDHPYIFGVQTNIMRHTRLLGELLAGGPEGFAELGRLRAIMRGREANLGTYSLAKLVDDSVVQWMQNVSTFMRPPRCLVPHASNLSISQFGLELSRNEQRALEEKMLHALDEGVRHFHLNFAVSSVSATIDVEGRLFALRLVEALAILKQKHLHYLRDALVFSLRAKPSQMVGCLEILVFLRAAGFIVCLWLLDVSNATPADVCRVWPEIDQAWRNKLVLCVGLYGGGPQEFAAANSGKYVKPAVQALDIYVGVKFNCRQWVHLNKVSQSGVVVMTCQPFGVRNALLSDLAIKAMAKERDLDPAMLLLKWAEGQNYLCVAPFVSQGSVPSAITGNELPFVIQGTRRTFVRRYADAVSAEAVVQSIKRRFPNTVLDNIRQPPVAKQPTKTKSGAREALKAARQKAASKALPRTDDGPGVPTIDMMQSSVSSTTSAGMSSPKLSERTLFGGEAQTPKTAGSGSTRSGPGRATSPAMRSPTRRQPHSPFGTTNSYAPPFLTHSVGESKGGYVSKEDDRRTQQTIRSGMPCRQPHQRTACDEAVASASTVTPLTHEFDVTPGGGSISTSEADLEEAVLSPSTPSLLAIPRLSVNHPHRITQSGGSTDIPKRMASPGSSSSARTAQEPSSSSRAGDGGSSARTATSVTSSRASLRRNECRRGTAPSVPASGSFAAPGGRSEVVTRSARRSG
eukprot:TRINITY_DN24147_c0_g1_i1.p1 TRINITY_DN24147_c0_g1~~TRINITY_DN24147_c0_g1_i1.p1  ORF type:complete len:1345 (+),score=220.93 TRINITY_DN24147_c0_g1_i1:54-4088(+)